MKKRVLIILLSVIVLIFGVLSVLFISCKTVKPLDIEFASVSNTNYNNYISNNVLDCNGDRLAWQSNSLLAPKTTIYDKNGENLVLTGGIDDFQLLEHKIVFSKNGNLFERYYEDNKKQLIAKNVSEFLATEECVYYLSDYILFEFDFTSKTSKELKNKIDFIYFHQNKLFAIDEDGQLFSLNSDRSWQTLCKLQIDFLPMCFMPQGDFLISIAGNEIIYTDINTGSRNVKFSLADNNYQNNRISFICDDELLYISFQATITPNSYSVKNVDDPANGLWCYDYSTNQLKKISNDVFEKLYLFENNTLLGVKNNQLQQIDTKNFF